MEKTFFGQVGDKVASLYAFENENVKMTVSDFGAELIRLAVRDRAGQFRDVVLGFNTFADYQGNDDTYFGAIVGRNCNRIGDAQFQLGGKLYTLDKNDGENNLHSGVHGYQIRLWDVEPDADTGNSANSAAKNAITFVMHSPDGDQGYPGALDLKVTYTLLDDGISITYNGQADATTIINPTNHSYFNLNGHGSGDILSHTLQMNAAFYTPVKDAAAIPTGEILSVKDTPFDFTEAKEIGRDINSSHPQMVYGLGYDHNWAITSEADEPFATVFAKESGIEMKAYTDRPGVQFYSGNFMKEQVGKDGATYNYRTGLCLETQMFPNAINTKTFASPIISAGQNVTTQTQYRFATR